MQTSTLLVTSPAEAEEYAHCWRAWARTPFQSPEWQLNWWHNFQTQNSQLNLLVVRDQHSQPIGLAPLYLRDHWALGRSVRFLGSGEACTDFQTLLCSPEYETQVGAAIGEWFVSPNIRKTWSYIELEGVQGNDQAIEQLVSRLVQAGAHQQSQPLENTWRVHLAEGWTGFLSGMSKTQRSQTKTLINRFDKSAELQLRWYRSADDFESGLKICQQLHQLRWNAVQQPGCFAEANFERFIKQACCALVPHRESEIVVLLDCGRPVAALLLVADVAGTYYVYQSGRDPAEDRNRVGTMLNALTIRDACDRELPAIDFLRGNEIYKPRLGGAPSACLRLRIVAPNPMPRLRHAAWSIGRTLRDQARRWKLESDKALTN
jgi:CelD/BcsL family acetyltransferase involved in cellulose biosynthesis